MKCLKPFALAVLVTAASCSKEPSYNKGLPVPSEAVLSVSVDALGRTKAAGSTDAIEYETRINSIQLLVFDSESGQLNHYADLGTDISASASIYTGPKKVYALANGPDLKDIYDLDGLCSLEFPVGSNSKSGAFLMFAEEDIVLEQDTELTLYLQRLLSRIRVASISNNLPAAYGTVQLKSVRMGNVPSSISWNGGYVQSSLLNPKGVTDNPVQPLTAISLPGVDIANGSAVTSGFLLYTYRNSSATDPTFVTIEMLIADRTYYYPIYFDNRVLEPNSTVDVSLNVVGLGSDTPWDKVEKSSATVDLQIRQWSFAAAYTENI